MIANIAAPTASMDSQPMMKLRLSCPLMGAEAVERERDNQ